MDGVEGEEVAMSRLDGVSAHPIIDAIRGSLQKLDHGLHGFHGLAAARPRLISVVPGRTVSGQSNRGRPNTFLKLCAHRALRGEPKLKSRKSLISRIGLLQVVDFHDFSGYFSWLLWSPFAVMALLLEVQKQLTQLVDFHDSFR